VAIGSRVEAIDRRLSNATEVSGYRFVEMLNARIYGKTWDESTRLALDALCDNVHDRLYTKAAPHPFMAPTCESMGRSTASANASDAYNAARRNLIYAIIEQQERGANARSQMEIVRDKRTAENQLVAFLTFTGFMGDELARQYVRDFEGMVKREVHVGVAPAVMVGR